jgi:hypothetical protein
MTTPRPPSLTTPPDGYADWLAELKARIHGTQRRAALAANCELVLLYWQIGRDILDRQSRGGWGAKVVDRLARDLLLRLTAAGRLAQHDERRGARHTLAEPAKS